MKVNKIVKIKIELDANEIEILDKARAILDKASDMMMEEGCDTISCADEYTYDISDLIDTRDFLENFIQVTEIFA